MFTARPLRRKLAPQKDVRVNIACGNNPIEGWINLDAVSDPGVYFWDCSLQFSDDAAAAIYSEHFSSISIWKPSPAHSFGALALSSA